MKSKPIDAIWTDQQWSAIAIRNSNVLVSAGAGSGKTAVLSERVLDLVSDGVDVTDLIVLTFTNAAAAEMKQRIRNKLLKAGATNADILANANKIDQSFITTFDSYCLYLVKKYNYILNIGQNISVIDNITASTTKYQIMNQVLEEQVSTNNQAVIDFISDYSSTSIDEIISLLISWYNSSTQNMHQFSNIEPNQVFIEFERIALQTKAEIVKLVNEINLYAADTALPEKINERCQYLITAETYEQIHSSIDFVFEKKWMIPRTDFDNKDYVKSLNEQLKAQLKKLQGYCAKTKDTHLQLLIANQQVKTTINQLLEIFKAKFDLFKRENGLFEFVDINLMAIDLLEKNSQICEQLKARTYEIMIDEYQDTNDIQEKFISLIANNNVYMVGDIKQSIYGFRNANPRLFAEKFKAYAQGNGGQLITLTSNFRSRAAVLDQVNDFFKQVMSSEYGGIDYDYNQKMEYGNKNFELLADTNKCEIITYNSKEIEIDKSDYEIIQIFKDIQTKIDNKYQIVDDKITRSVRLSDFAIICATREKFGRIVEIGEYFNISVNADILKQFASSIEIAVIQSALNLLNVIKKGSDDDCKFIYSVTLLARSYLFDYSDAQIDKLITTFNKIGQDKVSKWLYALESGELSELGLILKDLSRNIELKSTSYIVSQIIENFGIVEKLYRINDPLTSQMRINKLVSLIEDYDNRSYDLNTVCQILNETSANSDLDIEFNTNSDIDTDSVTVITTHKSKGLEYNICYFPFLFKKFNVMDINSKTAYTHDLHYIFPAKLPNGNLTSTIEKTIFDYRSKNELISEKIRLFYVAITRAKDKNILILDTDSLENDKVKSIATSNTLNDLVFNGWNSLKKYVIPSHQISEELINASIYNRFKREKHQPQKQLIPITYKELDISVTNYEKRRASGHIAEVITPKVASNIELGNLIHHELEFYDLFNLDTQIESAEGQVKIALQNIQKSGLLTGMTNYYPEFQFRLISDVEVNGIIDLLVENDKEYIIIDYKLSNIEKEEYVNQVMTYVNYIESITEKKVKGYLLSLLNGTIKQVY